MIAVTGATGFIGRRLVLHLREAGVPVRALARDPRRAAPLAAAGAEVTRGDLADPQALARLLRGARALVHCAGAVRGRTPGEFLAVNRDPVAGLLDAAAQAGVARVLLLSSLAARHPELSPYAQSKRLGEAAALGHPAGLPLAILRPPAVYGPGDRELAALFWWLERGWLWATGPRQQRLSLLFVDDLVAAIDQWLRTPTPVTGIFPLADGTPDGYTWPDLAEEARRALGRPIRLHFLPARLLRSAGRLTAALARLTGRPPMLSPGKVRELRHPDWRCDHRAFAAATGWEPRVRFGEGLARTLAARREGA
ncbi:MAG: hypothetical protein KatS3mg124_0348 [Porticoccaceae bacterium]|nr:MAG: hypothetical protein KatS3mg124_0348 [Porticoccaceae bacterium]